MLSIKNIIKRFKKDGCPVFIDFRIFSKKDSKKIVKFLIKRDKELDMEYIPSDFDYIFLEDCKAKKMLKDYLHNKKLYLNNDWLYF